MATYDCGQQRLVVFGTDGSTRGVTSGRFVPRDTAGVHLVTIWRLSRRQVTGEVVEDPVGRCAGRAASDRAFQGDPP